MISTHTAECEYTMLKDTQIKNLKAKDKLYRVTDFGGLIIEVKPSGVKSWRYRCRINGKATMLTIGDYPDVSLAEARRTRDDFKKQIKAGVDPRIKESEAEPEPRYVPTFGELYDQWYELNVDAWAPAYAKDLDERCQNHLLPFIADREVDSIDSRQMLEIFKRIEKRGTLNMLKKVRGYASRVFRYSVGMGHCQSDPVRDLPEDVFKKEQPQNLSIIRCSFLLSIARNIFSYFECMIWPVAIDNLRTSILA